MPTGLEVTIENGDGLEDNWLDEANPTTNRDGTTIKLGWESAKGLGAYRPLLDWDVLGQAPYLENAYIWSANLKLWCTTAAASGELYWIRRVVTGIDPSETRSNWNDATSVSSWTTGGGDYTTTSQAITTLPTSTGEVSIAIVTLLRDAISESGGYLRLLMMRLAESGADAYCEFASHTHGSAQKPQLYVDYSPWRAPATRNVAVIG